MKTILIAEDEPEVRNYLGMAVNCHGYDTEFAQDGTEALDVLQKLRGDISLLLLDLFMPYKDGFETLKEVRSVWPDLPVVALSGSCTPANVASVLRAGAIDFLSKPVSHEELGYVITSALTLSRSGRNDPLERLNTSTPDRSSPARATWAQKLDALLNNVAAADVPVLLRGETGVGKEVVARRLHNQSKRAGRPFLKLNCAALPSELAESELFGYERGAFTGAFKPTPGKFEMANSGTILLDEIGDMDFRLQAKLLQVLQDHEFLRLGAKDTSKVDVRVMAATHCDLEQAVSEGKFRQDLYYRLNVVEIHVPPLRERRDEILGLAEFFIQKHSVGERVELPGLLQELLLEHDWPGNVRELENVVRKFLVFKSIDVVTNELRRKAKKLILLPASAGNGLLRSQPSFSTAHREDSSPVKSPQANRTYSDRSSFQEPISHGTSTPDCPNPGDSQLSTVPRRDFSQRSPQPIAALAEVEGARRRAETEAILAALNSTHWNRKQAAKLLNVEYKAFLYKTKKLGIAGRMATPATGIVSPEIS
jgi:DNA-binding NtrC family response regulator